jgi:hypothetical protein
VSADDPSGFALGLAYKILGPLGAQWFYQGEKPSDALRVDCRPGSDDHRADQLATTRGHRQAGRRSQRTLRRRQEVEGRLGMAQASKSQSNEIDGSVLLNPPPIPAPRPSGRLQQRADRTSTWVASSLRPTSESEMSVLIVAASP